jgi:hypothetical protein
MYSTLFLFPSSLWQGCEHEGVPSWAMWIGTIVQEEQNRHDEPFIFYCIFNLYYFINLLIYFAM